MNSVGVDPAPATRTKITVAAPTGYTVAAWMALFKTAAEAVGINDFIVDVETGSCLVTCLDIGAVKTVASVQTSGFTLLVKDEGFGGSLGRTSEGIELSVETSSTDLTANQSGSVIVDSFIVGITATISCSLIDLSPEQYELIIGRGYGSTLTVGSDKLIGFGTARLNQSSFNLGGKLILHPLRLSAGDRSEDVVFWKTLPSPSTLNFDSGAVKALAVEFKALQDPTKDSTINIMAFGDWRVDAR